MSRDYPIILSCLLGVPLLGSGVYLYMFSASIIEFYNITYMFSPLQLRQYGAVPLMIFGAFIVLVGIYVQFASPGDPNLQDDEELIEKKKPSQRVAYSQLIISLPFLIFSLYMLFYTFVPYVYPMIAFLLGLYFFSAGVKRYWINTLTSYYITTRRVISEYRFISLKRQELPLDKVRGIEERKSITEALTQLGNIRVASGGGGGSVQLKIRNIRNSSEFADNLRNLV